MLAIKKLHAYLEVIVLLPPGRLGVMLPDGSCLYFKHDAAEGKWKEYLSIPKVGTVTETQRQEAWEILHGFLNALR